MPTDKKYLYVSPTFKYLPATCWLWLFAMSWQGRWWELMSSVLPMVRATETQQCGSIKQWDEKCKEVQSTLLILRGAAEFMSNLHCFYIRASSRLMSVLISCGFGKQLRVMCLHQPVKTVSLELTLCAACWSFFLSTSCTFMFPPWWPAIILPRLPSNFIPKVSTGGCFFSCGLSEMSNLLWHLNIFADFWRRF